MKSLWVGVPGDIAALSFTHLFDSTLAGGTFKPNRNGHLLLLVLDSIHHPCDNAIHGNGEPIGETTKRICCTLYSLIVCLCTPMGFEITRGHKLASFFML